MYRAAWVVAIIGIVAMFISDSYAPAFFALGGVWIIGSLSIIFKRK
jgi:hypothetical protein